MTGLVDQFASQIGWPIAANNVIVEGTSDVEYLSHASYLYAREYGRSIFDASFALVAAGRQDDGGVDGINRRLNTARQLADADRDQSGALSHTFIGLFDNDHAGRRAFDVARRFDRRLVHYSDLFLLHPAMPLRDGRSSCMAQQMMRENLIFKGLDWEIEDLCSERLLQAFERENPRAVLSRQTVAGRTHRELQRRAKLDLRRYFVREATLEDVGEMVTLLKALRSYVGAEHDFISAP